MLTVRYALELAIIIPAVIFGLMPVIDSLRIKLPFAVWAFGIAMAVMIPGGSFIGVKYGVRVRALIVAFSAVIFAAYFCAVDSDAGKKLFCLFESYVFETSLFPLF